LFTYSASRIASTSRGRISRSSFRRLPGRSATTGLSGASPTLRTNVPRGSEGGITSSSSNASVQYVIATATGNSSSGFGTQYCAWHSSTSSSYGNIAYTNLPYLTDAGASCGANFNGLGAKAGITIVGGHEMAETMSDQFPNGGWLDGGGAENGDKCAWITTGNPGASANVSLGGHTYPVQSLWSNAANNNAGGCVLSY